MRLSRLWVGWGAVSVMACAQTTPSPPAPVANAPAPTVTGATSAPAPLAAPSASSQPEAEPPPAAPPVSEAFAEMNNAFALRLFSVLGKTRGNLFVSPASVSTALAMTYAGAKGKTASEMEHALSFSLSAENLHAEVARASQRLLASSTAGGPELRIANRLWPDQRLQLEPSFVELTQRSYGAPPEPLDFVRASEPSRVRINAWVAEQTQQLIPELLKKDMVGPETALVLTNAVYFKGKWAEPFKAKDTKQEPFTPENGPAITTPLMHGYVHGHYGETSDALVLELPYQGARGGAQLVMDVILPKVSSGLGAVEKKLVSGGLEPYLVRLVPRLVGVTLPRFKLSWNGDLKQPLQALGMHAAFGAGADFSGLAKERLSIDRVQHEAVVEVNEEGTVAAAATAVVAVPISAEIPVTFRADRAFLFLLRDAESGLVLFMGRLAMPS